MCMSGIDDAINQTWWLRKLQENYRNHAIKNLVAHFIDNVVSVV